MPFPSHIEQVLSQYGVRPDTKEALYELYLILGSDVLEVFADVADTVASPSLLEPEDTLQIRERVIERYLRRHHPQWLAGTPTPSLWHPREAEGRASGLVVPLGAVSETVRRVLPDGQSVADGILVLGRNAHSGGRAETISFDVVARTLDDAIAIALSDGRQHTVPGSVGETSGTYDSIQNVALLWEVQPNVYKPSGERNRSIAKIHRRHRSWHLVTLAAALEWLTAQKAAIFILRGGALAATHEVNPAQPVSEEIASMHDRTVAAVTRSHGLSLCPTDDADELLLLDTSVMNHALRQHVLKRGAGEAIWKLVPAEGAQSH